MKLMTPEEYRERVKEYLLGYVAGVEREGRYSEDLIDEQVKRKCGIGMSGSVRTWESKVFPTREAASKAIKALDWRGRKFTRGYIYSTPNPQNAKNLPLATEENTVTQYL